MEEVTYQIHWLSFTVHAEESAAYKLFDEVFKEHIGELEELGHGGRGFKCIQNGLHGFKLYTQPTSGKAEYFHFEIPGQVCEVLPWTRFQLLLDYLEMEHPQAFKFTRLDFAFDHVNFTPQQVEDAIRADQLRSLAKRETTQIHITPFAKRDDGEEGTYTISLGANTSERMITVYNKRGYTRLEFQTRNNRAHVVARGILIRDVERWGKVAISHLRDYVDFLPDWWAEFVNGQVRAELTISSSREVSMQRTLNWLEKQVSPALSVVNDALSPEAVGTLILRGRKKRGARYGLLLRDDTQYQA